MPVLAAILVLALLIVVHELGHFAAARLQKIRVSRFSIGFGPVLVKYQGAETEYAVRAFPLGGYVGFPDDDPESDISPEDPNLLRNRPVLDRAIVISAGVIANLIFAYFLLVGQAAIVGIPEFSEPGVLIPQVVMEEGAAAWQAGVKPGDIILEVNYQPLGSSRTVIDTLKQEIQNSPNQPLDLKIKRGDELLNLTVTPNRDSQGRGKLGIMLAPHGKVTRRLPIGIAEAFAAGAQEYQYIATLTVQGFSQLLSNFGETAQQVAGPVAIVAIGADLARDDAGSLFQFGALISINLAIINILPLPALDGGQLVFLMIEGLRGKPLPSRVQDGIMQTGLVLLLGLGVFLIIRDTVNLAFFQELFQ